MVTGQKQLPYKIIKGDGVCEIYLKPISEEKLFFVWRTIYDGYQRIWRPFTKNWITVIFRRTGVTIITEISLNLPMKTWKYLSTRHDRWCNSKKRLIIIEVSTVHHVFFLILSFFFIKHPTCGAQEHPKYCSLRTT